MSRTPRVAILLWPILGCLVADPAPGVAAEIAGLAPDRRPAGAPTITEVGHPPGWTEQALRGVSEPIPPGLGFLADQGAWYTPFDRPNATGLYDIRQLHESRPAPEG